MNYQSWYSGGDVCLLLIFMIHRLKTNNILETIFESLLPILFIAENFAPQHFHLKT